MFGKEKDNEKQNIPMGKILCIVGKSGSGKTYLFNRIKEDKDILDRYNLHIVKAYTTRPPRPHSSSNEYQHISETEYRQIKLDGHFASNVRYTTEYGTWYYGHKNLDLDNEKHNYILCCAIEEIVSLRAKYKDRIHLIYIDTDDEERVVKLFSREDGLSYEEKVRRLKSEMDSFYNLLSLNKDKDIKVTSDVGLYYLFESVLIYS